VKAKISITTKCNAHCITCPVWKYEGHDMELDDFKKIWSALNESDKIDQIMLNNTGDLYNHSDHVEILKIIEETHKKTVIMTTNAALMDYVPSIEVLVISFNGIDRQTYEEITGLDFYHVTANIRNHYKDFFDKLRGRGLEMHCLVWDKIEGREKEILNVWHDFPGHIRLSYKYDNQFSIDHTIESKRTSERVPCDYLDTLSIMPDGKVVSCAHDFKMETDYGNILTTPIDKLIWNRERMIKRMEHSSGIFSGLCEKCNYNTPVGDRVIFLT
jgi:radical SAM protein with 4Fe4S-binding SPASM domain